MQDFIHTVHEEGVSVEAKEISLTFKALSDETRVKILTQLMEGEQCACTLMRMQKLTQPTLAYHMQILCLSGLVESKRIGRWMHYALSRQGFAQAQGITQQYLHCTEQEPFCNTSCC